MTIRRAAQQDIPRVQELLHQVLEVHAAIRPDLFVPGTTKYTPAELAGIFADEETPVFVAVDDSGLVLGHAFCVLRRDAHPNIRCPFSLYIDDICVDEAARGQHVASALYAHVLDYARVLGCSCVTLNVWEGNAPARAFYERMGMRVRSTTMEQTL